MIPVNDLLFEIDEKLNKNANLQGQFIPDEDKITFANRAQIKLILKKLGLNNVYQSGLDAFKKRYQDLEAFIVYYEKLDVTSTPGDNFNSYQTPLSNTSSKYFMPIDSYIVCSKGNCKNRILDIIDIVKHGDIQTKLKSSHWTPSFEYQESVGVISNNVFYSYPDIKNTFKIDNLYLSYLRYPKEIDVPGYTHIDGSPSVLQDCELDAYLKNELLELIITEISDTIGDQSQSQLSRERSKETE